MVIQGPSVVGSVLFGVIRCRYLLQTAQALSVGVPLFGHSFDVHEVIEVVHD